MMMCKAIRYEGSWPRSCHREAVINGLCKAHAAGKKRQEATAKIRDEQWNARAARLDEVARLAASIEIRASVALDTDKVVMSFDTFVELVNRVGKVR